MRIKEQYAEIRHDYMFGPAVEPGATCAYDNGLFVGVAIDAWKTDDDDEGGETIAQVMMSIHGDVMVAWYDNSARLDESVLEAVDAAKKDLADVWKDKHQGGSRLYFLKDEQGDLGLIQVNNWDETFEQRMEDAYEQWPASEGNHANSFCKWLKAYGYDVDEVRYEEVVL